MNFQILINSSEALHFFLFFLFNCCVFHLKHRRYAAFACLVVRKRFNTWHISLGMAYFWEKNTHAMEQVCPSQSPHSMNWDFPQSVSVCSLFVILHTCACVPVSSWWYELCLCVCQGSCMRDSSSLRDQNKAREHDRKSLNARPLKNAGGQRTQKQVR